MARTKGSKNRTKVKVDDLDSLNAQIVEKLNTKATLEQEADSITASIAESKLRLKEIRATLKKLDKNITALESMREQLGTAKMMEKAMSELQPKITALLNSGKTIDDIVEMLVE